LPQLEIPEHQLHSPEHSFREDRVQLGLRVRESLLGGRPRLSDETEICLDQRFCPADPVSGMRMLCLHSELVGDGRMAERVLPATGEPLDEHERPEG
jgi:hypothetical protein